MKIKHNNRGEIVTLLTIGIFLFIGFTTLASSLFLKTPTNKMATNSRADEWNCPGGACDKCGQDGPWHRTGGCPQPTAVPISPTVTPPVQPVVTETSVPVPTAKSSGVNIPAGACTQCAANGHCEYHPFPGCTNDGCTTEGQECSADKITTEVTTAPLAASSCTKCGSSGHCEYHPFPGCTNDGCTVEGKQCSADKITTVTTVPTFPASVVSDTPTPYVTSTASNTYSDSDFCAQNPEVCRYRNGSSRISPEISNTSPQWSMPWDWLGDRIKKVQQPQTSPKPRQNNSVVDFSQDVTLASNPELAYLSQACNNGTGANCSCVNQDTCIAVPANTIGNSGFGGGGVTTTPASNNGFLGNLWNQWSASPINPDNIVKGIQDKVSSTGEKDKVVQTLQVDKQQPTNQDKFAEGIKQAFYAPFDAFGEWSGWNNPTRIMSYNDKSVVRTDQSLGTIKTPWNQFQDNVNAGLKTVAGFFGINPQPTSTPQQIPAAPMETLPKDQVAYTETTEQTITKVTDAEIKNINAPTKLNSIVGIEGLDLLSPTDPNMALPGMHTRVVALDGAFNVDGTLKDPSTIAYTQGDALEAKRLADRGVDVSALFSVPEGKDKTWMENAIRSMINSVHPDSLIIGNEMNLPENQYKNMNQYYENLRTVYGIAKSINPNIKIYPYGIAPGRYAAADNQPPVDEKGNDYTSQQGYVGLQNMLNYYDKNPSSGSQKYPFDGIDAHLYFPWQMDQTITKYKTILDTHGAGNMPVMVGEVGLPTHDQTVLPKDQWDVHWQSLNTQANLVWQDLTIAQKQGVSSINYFTAKDPPGIPADGDKWGLVSVDGQKRPAYDAFSYAQKIFNNVQKTTYQENKDVVTTTLDHTDGTSAQVVWNKNWTESRTLVNIPPESRVFDKYGKEVTITRDKNNIGTLTLPHSDNAWVAGDVYVIVGKPGKIKPQPTVAVKIRN